MSLEVTKLSRLEWRLWSRGDRIQTLFSKTFKHFNRRDARPQRSRRKKNEALIWLTIQRDTAASMLITLSSGSGFDYYQ